MYTVRTYTDEGWCQDLWKRFMPQELVSDLWEVRNCFHQHYRHRLHFVVAERGGRVVGFLPLSWNQETGSYAYFPGETWEGKTWLEQNRIIAESREVLDDMLATLAAPYHLRYLRPDGDIGASQAPIDEIGYLFLPSQVDFDMERYFGLFSTKSAKKLRRELSSWEQRRVTWRYDEPGDFEIMIDMNLRRYGDQSYFHDERFRGSFRSLMRLLTERGWLRLVTVLVDGVPAATDMGSLHNGMLTLLAGGTNGDFPGIAKLINVQHMQWACDNRLDSVDFLCGDFNWKSHFHLTQMPLYVLQNNHLATPAEAVEAALSEQYALPQVASSRAGDAS
jgi:hypothetical protein